MRGGSKRRVFVLLQMRCELVALVIWTFLRTTVGNSGYELRPYQESPDVYFEDLGHTTLSTTAWTIVVYIPMQMTTSETTDLERYAHYIEGTCSRLTVRNWTACSHFGDKINRRLQQIRDTQDCCLILYKKGRQQKAQKGII
jgi:hypothetical protein